ncbi:MAG: hypothetical protein CM1200mP24_10170 [Gammaproteobacteria bacterium]|nr:MAG: hypothetical protein CM1200mP24_10170 [Gammaproteobacteria bacterium]
MTLNLADTRTCDKRSGSIHLHGANLTYSGKGEETHQIRDGDPLSHQIEMAYTITLEREDPKWQIRTGTHTLVTATESDFRSPHP